jgi:hypothetical protein
MAGPHDRDWAGAGFTKPGPGSDPGYQAGYALGQADALAGTTTIFDGPAASLNDGYINGHQQMTEHLAHKASGRELPACEPEPG